MSDFLKQYHQDTQACLAFYDRRDLPDLMPPEWFLWLDAAKRRAGYAEGLNLSESERDLLQRAAMARSWAWVLERRHLLVPVSVYDPGLPSWARPIAWADPVAINPEPESPVGSIGVGYCGLSQGFAPEAAKEAAHG